MAPPDIEERIRVVKRHLKLSLEWKGERVGILEMRKHYTRYLKGYRDIKSFRMALVTENDPNTLFTILDEIEEKYK
jgi:tRNA-dihydrouridine synthase